MAVSKRVRFEVFKRDRFACQYCGRRPPDVVLEVDHIIPRVEGGPDDIHNLTTACLPCNRGKAGVPLENVAPALDEMEIMAGLQEMLERMMELKRSAAVVEAKREMEEELIDQVADWWEMEWQWSPRFDAESVRQFIQKGLSMEDLRSAIDATVRKWNRKGADGRRTIASADLFKYFSGVCWTMLRERDGG